MICAAFDWFDTIPPDEGRMTKATAPVIPSIIFGLTQMDRLSKDRMFFDYLQQYKRNKLTPLPTMRSLIIIIPLS